MVGFVHANRGGSPCPGTPGDKTDDYRQLATVLRHLARWGYVVISTDASGSPPGPAYREDLLVSSLRFLIDEADRNGSPFQGKLKTTGVILAGHSTGGGAAMTNSGDPTLDVGAIVTLVPSSPQPPPDLSIPTLVIGVSEDDGTFGGNAGALYTQAGVPKHLVQITGANHFGFTEELCFGTDGQATISREDQQRVAIAYITAFLQLYIRNDVSYQQVLRGAEQIESLEPFGIDVQFET
jgi:predicted dienelactone hydrolase